MLQVSCIEIIQKAVSSIALSSKVIFIIVTSSDFTKSNEVKLYRSRITLSYGIKDNDFRLRTGVDT